MYVFHCDLHGFMARQHLQLPVAQIPIAQHCMFFLCPLLIYYMQTFTLSDLGVFLGVLGGILTTLLLTIQKSKCKHIKCCGCECDRDRTEPDAPEEEQEQPNP